MTLPGHDPRPAEPGHQAPGWTCCGQTWSTDGLSTHLADARAQGVTDGRRKPRRKVRK